MSTNVTEVAAPERVLLEIPKLLAWDAGKAVNTSNGPRTLYKAKATPEFRQLWRDHKVALKAAGLSWPPGDKQDFAEVLWWKPIPKSEDQVKRERDAVAASHAMTVDPDYKVPVPPGRKLAEYQLAGVKFMEPLEGILLGDEMGTGKTIEACAFINTSEQIHRVLVICPASLKINWFRELSAWLVRKQSVGIATADCFPSTDIVIINYQILHKFPKRLDFNWDLVIIDEAHNLRNPKARQTKCVFGYQPTKKEMQKGETIIPALPSKRRMCLTGTPIPNRVKELFPILHYLDPQRWNNFFKFGLRYCAGKQGGFGWDFSGSSNEEELQQILRTTCMLRRLKNDVLKDLPPKRRRIVELPSEGMGHVIDREKKAFAHNEEELLALKIRFELASAGEDEREYEAAKAALSRVVKAKFTEMSRLRHETAIAKLPLCIEHIKEIWEDSPGRKLIIFAHHQDVIAQLREAIPGHAYLIGGMSPEEKQRNVDRFQNDPLCPAFIGSLTAAGVGLTLIASSHVIFVEEDWVPGNVTQCEDRAHRWGQKDSVLVDHLVLAGSLDCNFLNTNIRKQVISDKCLDNPLAAAMFKAVPDVVSIFVDAAEDTEETPEGKPVRGSKWEKVEAEAKGITAEQIRLIHQGLQMLAGVCDGAARVDGAGFSKFDSGIGKSLASHGSLTAKQGVIGLRLIRKYKRQLGGLAERICAKESALDDDLVA